MSMLVWWGMSLLGAALAAGFGCYMWGSHNAEKELEREYSEGLEHGSQSGWQDGWNEAHRAIGVPRLGSVPVGREERRIEDHDQAGPGHTIYAELTPEALDDTPPPEPDAGFQDVTPADFLSLLSDDEFWPASKLYFAAARCLADAPWQPLPAWTPRMLERAA